MLAPSLWRNARELCQSLPMPWMWAMSARADVGGVGFRDAEGRRENGDCNCSECRLHFRGVRVFVGPTWFRGRTPSAFRGFVPALRFGMLRPGFCALRSPSPNLGKFDLLFS